MESFISKFEKEKKPPLKKKIFKNDRNEQEIEIFTLYSPLLYYEYNVL